MNSNRTLMVTLFHSLKLIVLSLRFTTALALQHWTCYLNDGRLQVVQMVWQEKTTAYWPYQWFNTVTLISVKKLAPSLSVLSFLHCESVQIVGCQPTNRGKAMRNYCLSALWGSLFNVPRISGGEDWFAPLTAIKILNSMAYSLLPFLHRHLPVSLSSEKWLNIKHFDCITSPP